MEMSIQRNVFLEDFLDFERSILHQLVPLGLIKQAQSSIMSHISHPLQFIFATLGIIDCPCRSHKMSHIVGTSNQKLQNKPFLWGKEQFSIMFTPSQPTTKNSFESMSKMDFTFPLKQQHLD